MNVILILIYVNKTVTILTAPTTVLVIMVIDWVQMESHAMVSNNQKGWDTYFNVI